MFGDHYLKDPKFRRLFLNDVAQHLNEKGSMKKSNENPGQKKHSRMKKTFIRREGYLQHLLTSFFVHTETKKTGQSNFLYDNVMNLVKVFQDFCLDCQHVRLFKGNANFLKNV